MTRGLLGVAVVASVLAVTAACGRSAASASEPAVRLADPDGAGAYIEVVGLADATLDALEDADLTPEQWPAVLRVAVDPEAPAMIGTYGIANGALTFTPLFPFDQGREYHVRFDPARVPGAAGPAGAALVATVARPASTAVPSTSVVRVYPTGDTVPENLLRLYVEFSGPMGRRSGVEHIALLDHAGQEIPGAVLPLDYEFWSPDHTRFTVFLDPGRVKEGILPNREMGRALEPGRSVTLVVSREWLDEHGLPLTGAFRREFRVAPPDTAPIDPAAWQIQAPRAGARGGLVVTFPEPLDHGLLMRAVGVTRGGEAIPGDVVVDPGETRWTFTPHEPWRAGAHHLIALDILEDLAGNQIGRAFEVDVFDTVDQNPDPETISLPFTVVD